MDIKLYKYPPDYRRLCRAVNRMKRYACVRVCSIGKSVLGRDIFLLRFGQCPHPTLFVGAVHGMEWITELLMLRFAQSLAEAIQSGEPLADTYVTRCFEDRSLAIVPCLNPDGVQISLCGSSGAGALSEFVENVSGGDTSRWQANARGVDINHNFDAGFCIAKRLEQSVGIVGPGPTRYGGLCAHSEPETRAIVRFCENERPRQLYAFHSQGEEIYYRYGSRTPPRSALMAQVLASLSGYSLENPDPIAAHAGLKDWFIQSTGKPGFTFEVGRGTNPIGADELEPIYARLLETLLCAALL